MKCLLLIISSLNTWDSSNYIRPPQTYWYDDDKDDEEVFDVDYSDKGVKIAKPGNEETSTSEGFEILANILDFIRHG